MKEKYLIVNKKILPDYFEKVVEAGGESGDDWGISERNKPMIGMIAGGDS